MQGVRRPRGHGVLALSQRVLGRERNAWAGKDTDFGRVVTLSCTSDRAAGTVAGLDGGLAVDRVVAAVVVVVIDVVVVVDVDVGVIVVVLVVIMIMVMMMATAPGGA